MRLSSPIYKLKRKAKRLARDSGARLHEALDRIARTEGFRDWSHLASQHFKSSPAREVLGHLRSGDLVLVGARPGQGKTLLGLELAALSGGLNRTGHFFTLECTEPQVLERFEALGITPKGRARPVVVDTSDGICASYIIDRLERPPEDALIVVDYLQLLEQRRSNPPLAEQVRALKAFAVERGACLRSVRQALAGYRRHSSAQSVGPVAV